MERVDNDQLLADRGWDLAFWVCLDDVPVHDCFAIVGHRWGNRLDDGWEIDRLEPTSRGVDGATEDAEAMARWGDRLFVFGSHFGSKDGPLQPERAFIGQLRESEVHWNEDGDPVGELQVRRNALALHRLVNDGLADAGIDLVELGPAARVAFIDGTRDQHEDERWVELLHDDDHPINIEGTAFRPDGSVLLGLRYPTTAEGEPILVQMSGLPGWFAGDRSLEVTAVWAIGAVGRDGSMAGVRDLTALGSELHVVTGNVDSRQKGSVLLEDHPEGRDTRSTHWRCELPWDRNGGRVDAERLVEFPDMPRIEGVATDPQGRFYYVSDEDEAVRVRYTCFVPPGS